MTKYLQENTVLQTVKVLVQNLIGSPLMAAAAAVRSFNRSKRFVLVSIISMAIAILRELKIKGLVFKSIKES
jgi:hypothetical protein